jgi:transposase
VAVGDPASQGPGGRKSSRGRADRAPTICTNGQLISIRDSRVKAMDETPVKAGCTDHGKMRPGYFWPVYGGHDEVCFPFFASRHAEHVRALLGAKHDADTVL